MRANGQRPEHAHWFDPMYGLQALVRDEDERWRAIVTFQRDGDRLAVRKVEMTATEALDVAAWRSFPLARVESQANLPHYYRLMIDHERSVPPYEDATLPVEDRERARKRPLPVGRFVPPPEGVTRYPDAHYQRVADVYRFHVEHGNPPAKRMSEDWGVPISSINRWTKEARRRGLLAQARSRGRAG